MAFTIQNNPRIGAYSAGRNSALSFKGLSVTDTGEIIELLINLTADCRKAIAKLGGPKAARNRTHVSELNDGRTLTTFVLTGVHEPLEKMHSISIIEGSGHSGKNSILEIESRKGLPNNPEKITIDKKSLSMFPATRAAATALRDVIAGIRKAG